MNANITSLCSRMTRSLVAGSLVTLTMALALQSGPVHAASTWWTVTHASGCMTFGGRVLDNNFSIWNDSQYQEMTVLCPIPNATHFPLSKLTAAGAFGKDGSLTKSVVTMLCVSYRSAVGGLCNAPSVTGPGTDEFLMTMDTQSGKAEDRYAYIFVRLPERQGDSRSGLRGVKTWGGPN